MTELRLRFPQHDQADLALGAGQHGLVRRGDAIVAEPGDAAPVRVCVDRRGVWMTLEPGAHAVHVNGRPVRRMAMLRAGDAVHLDGLLVQLLAANDVDRRVPEPRTDGAGESRLVLRGVGGQHHGRCFELSRVRVVGRMAGCDIMIDSPDFADRHARLEPHGDMVVLRALAPGDASVVNGEPVRDAVLRSGDQVVFDAHHRFVVEAPGRPQPRAGAADAPAPSNTDAPVGSGNARRMPWLLVAALLLAAALAALLLFGAA